MSDPRYVELKTVVYGCKDKPEKIMVTVPKNIEAPFQIRLRYPDEEYAEYDFWWTYALP